MDIEPPGSSQQAETRDKPRVLHVLASLRFAGLETALMHIFRQQKESSVRHEVLLTKDEEAPHTAEAMRLGVPVHVLPISAGKATWLARFRHFLLEQGPYTAVHAHLYLFSAAILAAARSAGVPVRIAHCHNARTQGGARSLQQRLVRQTAMRCLDWAATHRLGVSRAAAAEIAGRGWEKSNRAQVLPLGFDFSQAEGATERSRSLAKKLGLDSEGPIIGHVGRFDPVKNHRFLLDAFAHLKEQERRAQLVLVGMGPLSGTVQSQSADLGIRDSVHFVGLTNDVAAYMALFDILVLPSFSEGLGLVCLEAQAAGTRCLASGGVPHEVAVVPSGVEYLPLEAGPRAWAEAMRLLSAEPRGDAGSWRKALEESAFSVGRCIQELDKIYLSSSARKAEDGGWRSAPVDGSGDTSCHPLARPK